MTTTYQDHITSPPQPTPEPKPKFLAGLFSRRKKRDEKKQQADAKTYDGLVAALTELERTGKGKPPTDGDIDTILRVAEKTDEDLAGDVLEAVKIAELQTELQGEADAIDELADTNDAIKKHQAEAERVVLQLQSRGDQLNAQQREQQGRVAHFKSVRQRLGSLAGSPSEREVELDSKLTELPKQEMRLRAQAGQHPLAEKFINSTLEDSAEWQERQELDRKIAENETSSAGQNVYRGPRLQKMVNRRAELNATIERNRRLYELGKQVRAVRARKAELANERDRLAAERVAALERTE